MELLHLVILSSLLVSSCLAREVRLGHLTVKDNLDVKGSHPSDNLDGDCSLELYFRGLLLFCHSRERPVMFIGRGEFVAEDSAGNWRLNDTITGKV